MLGVLCGLIGVLTTSLPLILTAVCIVDLLRNDRPREWFWLVIFIPIIGPLAYLANFYIVEGFGGRQFDLSWRRHRRLKELKQLAAVQDTAGLWLEMGELHFQRKEWMPALKALQRALDLDETLLKAQYYAGAALCEVARHEAALPHLDYVLEHNRTTSLAKPRCAADAPSKPSVASMRPGPPTPPWLRGTPTGRPSIATPC